MTILSDRQIKALCLPPERVLDEEMYWAEVNKPKMEYAVWVPDIRQRAANQRAEQEAMRERCMRPITEAERTAFVPMLSPFEPKQVREVKRDDKFVNLENFLSPNRRVISYGVTSYGYDARLADDDIQIFSNVNAREIDPKNLDPEALVQAKVLTANDGSKYFLLPPNSYALARTIEYWHMPKNVVAICVGKSTYARSGVAINVTPIEPGWHGNVVMEIANQTSVPVRIYLNEGISQFLFLQGEDCEVSYADRDGKYQGQTGVTLPRM